MVICPAVSRYGECVERSKCIAKTSCCCFQGCNTWRFASGSGRSSTSSRRGKRTGSPRAGACFLSVHQQTEEMRHDLLVTRGLPVHSLRLGISGQTDVVGFVRVSAEERVADSLALEGRSGWWRPPQSRNLPVVRQRSLRKPASEDRYRRGLGRSAATTEPVRFHLGEDEGIHLAACNTA